MARLEMDERELEQELHRVMQDVFLSLLNTTDGPAATHPVTPRLACRVAFRGEFEGYVAVMATFGLASNIAQRMFGSDLQGAPTDVDAQEALREVTNIVAGNLKPLFGGQNTLGLPEDLPSDTALPHHGQLAGATTDHQFGTLEVRVYAAL